MFDERFSFHYVLRVANEMKKQKNGYMLYIFLFSTFVERIFQWIYLKMQGGNLTSEGDWKIV